MANSNLLCLIGLFLIQNGMNGETAQCGNPGKAFNGYIKPDRTKYQVGDQVDYECNSGFTKIRGNSQGTCLHNGTWDILPIPCGVDYAYRKPVIIDMEFPIETSTTYRSILSDHDPSTCVDLDLRAKNRFLKARIDHLDENFQFSIHSESVDSSKLKLWVIFSDMKKTFGGNILRSAQGKEEKNWFITFSDTFTWDSVALIGNWIESNNTLRLCDIEISIHPKGRKYNCGPLPQPINGIWTSNSTELVPNQQELFDEGFKAHFKCNFGFYLMGDSEAECFNGVWTFKTSSQKPVCIHFEPRCAYPGDPSYGRTVPRKEVYEIDEMVEYECGPGNVTTLYSQGHCQSDGSWDHLPSACGVNLAYKFPPFSTLSGKDLLLSKQALKSHSELVDGDASTCFDLRDVMNDDSMKRWFIWGNLKLSQSSDIRLRFNQTVNSSNVKLILNNGKDKVDAYKTGEELYFWISYLTLPKTSLRFILDYSIPLSLCEISIISDMDDTYQCGNPPSSLGGRYYLSSHRNRVNYECLSSEYRLIGPSSLSCEHGKWNNNPPVCLEDSDKLLEEPIHSSTSLMETATGFPITYSVVSSVPSSFSEMATSSPDPDISVITISQLNDDSLNNVSSETNSSMVPNSSESSPYYEYPLNAMTILVSGIAILILALVIGSFYLLRSKFTSSICTIKSRDELEMDVTRKSKECGPSSIQTTMKTEQPPPTAPVDHHYEFDPTCYKVIGSACSQVNRRTTSSNAPVIVAYGNKQDEEFVENIYEELIIRPKDRGDQQIIGIYNHLK